jgi:formylmethanofuran dehydrogenase subunit C
MTALRLALRAPPPMRLDLSPLVPERLAGLDEAAIARIELGTARAPARVGDVFDVRMGNAEHVAIEGSSERFDFVGAGMSGGTLTIEGDAGYCVGRRLKGGKLTIRGNAGGWAASGLRGGVFEIRGDTGPMLGAPLAGEPAGMAGGVALVRGSAGERAGDRMRRGLIVIEGEAGEAAGSRMLAGTLVVCRRTGPMPGYLMRRGTLLLAEADLPPTFVRAGGTTPVFLRLLARTLAEVSETAAQLAARADSRLVGDMATLGKGEVLLPGNVGG